MPDPSSRQPPRQVEVGTIVGTHGDRGRLRVEPSTDNPQRFREGAALLINSRAYTVRRVGRAPRGQLWIELEGLDSREEARAFVLQAVEVSADEVPKLPPGSYYHYELLDMTVKDSSGAVLGQLTEVLSTGANDVYVVTGPSSEILVPALADVVLEVDVEAAQMTVALPEGIEPRALTPARVRSRRRGRRPPYRQTST